MSEHLLLVKTFLDKVNTLNFWQRLFYWGRMKRGLVDAAASLASLQNELAVSQQSLTSANLQLSALLEGKRNKEALLQSMNNELGLYKERSENGLRELQTVKEENIQLKKDGEFRAKKYSEEIFALQALRLQLQEERAVEIQLRHAEELNKLKALKETWALHQDDVRGRIKLLCQKHTIAYVDKVPFKGDPDNTLFICDEYVVFDAKSPAGDDLKNFPLYLKTQAEAARKYAKLDGVKKDIFLVVPTNTMGCIKDFVYNLADYNVYILSADSLEPLILSLCRIEDYEFAEQLSPEDRENICRIIGKFAHLSKRRIQIDSFFARQFIELAYKCESSLPSDIHDKVLEFERSEKLNPPQEKRAKAINTKDIETEASKIDQEMEAKGVILPNAVIADVLNDLSLYK